MDKKPKGLQEGPPIYIYSCLTKEEWADCAKKYTTYSTKEPPQYIKDNYKGGTWR